jgi:hypothetical protein
VIPHSAAINAAEAELAMALVAMVGGPCPVVSPIQVVAHFEGFFQVSPQDVHVRRSYPNDFLLVFNNVEMVDQVLHAPLPTGATFSLHFCCWQRQSRALFRPP